jgi:hypothetical protein
MSYTGHVNIDCLIHDATSNAFKVFDVESSVSSVNAAVLVTGTATAEGVEIDPAGTGYRNAAGSLVVLATVSTIVCKGSQALTVTAGDVLVKSAAGKACVTALSDYSGNVTVSGSGSFSLVLIGDA